MRSKHMHVAEPGFILCRSDPVLRALDYSPRRADIESVGVLKRIPVGFEIGVVFKYVEALIEAIAIANVWVFRETGGLKVSGLEGFREGEVVLRHD